jgi:hypothetical protein
MKQLRQERKKSFCALDLGMWLADGLVLSFVLLVLF